MRAVSVLANNTVGICTLQTGSEVRFLNSEELSPIKSSALPAQLPRPGRSQLDSTLQLHKQFINPTSGLHITSNNQLSSSQALILINIWNRQSNVVPEPVALDLKDVGFHGNLQFHQTGKHPLLNRVFKLPVGQAQRNLSSYKVYNTRFRK